MIARVRIDLMRLDAVDTDNMRLDTLATDTMDTMDTIDTTDTIDNKDIMDTIDNKDITDMLGLAQWPSALKPRRHKYACATSGAVGWSPSCETSGSIKIIDEQSKSSQAIKIKPRNQTTF